MSKPELLVIGASARAAVESAARAGMTVAASDMFGDVDLREKAEFLPTSDYPGDFVSLLRRTDLPVLYTGGLENYPDVLAEAKQLLGNGPEVVSFVRDPFRWSALLSKHDFSVAKVRQWNDPPRDAGHWLAKSLSGAGGSHVRRSADAREGQYFQKLTPGLPCSAVFVGTATGASFCGATVQLIGPTTNDSPFCYWGSVGPLSLAEKTIVDLQRLGDVLAMEAEVRGLFGVDFMLTDNSVPIPIEINPRYTASVELIELITGQPLIPHHIEAFRGGLVPDSAFNCQRTAAKLIVYADTNITTPKLATVRQFSPECWLADIPNQGTTLPAQAPICSILTTAMHARQLSKSIVECLHNLELVTEPRLEWIKSVLDEASNCLA